MVLAHRRLLHDVRSKAHARERARARQETLDCVVGRVVQARMREPVARRLLARRRMEIGYKLMAEEHAPRALVENARRAEDAGFAFAALSDHFHPWLAVEGHSPLAWSVLGAAAQATRRLGLMTAVTCPTYRYHPAIVAQGAATVALLCEGRFTLGLGSG